MNFEELQTKLTALEVEAAKLHAEGDVITHARIEAANSKGFSVSGNASPQYRLLVDEEVDHYLDDSELTEVRAASERGKRLADIQAEIEYLKAQVENG